MLYINNSVNFNLCGKNWSGVQLHSDHTTASGPGIADIDNDDDDVNDYYEDDDEPNFI